MQRKSRNTISKVHCDAVGTVTDERHRVFNISSQCASTKSSLSLTLIVYRLCSSLQKSLEWCPFTLSFHHAHIFGNFILAMYRTVVMFDMPNSY